MTASFILALRFSVGTAGSILIYFKKLKVVDRSYLKCGFIMGLTLFLSFWIQVFGLNLDTTPGKSVFLSATYCIIVPFLYWVIIKEKPDKYNFVATLICILGIALVSLNENLYITGGDLMTLISGFFAAANIIATSLYCKNKDALILTIIQLAVVALLSWVIVIITKGIPGECSDNLSWYICYSNRISFSKYRYKIHKSIISIIDIKLRISVWCNFFYSYI